MFEIGIIILAGILIYIGYSIGYMRGIARGRDMEAEVLAQIEYERRRRGGI